MSSEELGAEGPDLLRGVATHDLSSRLGGLLEPADELPNPFEEAMRELIRRRTGEGLSDAAWELAWAAREAMFAKT